MYSVSTLHRVIGKENKLHVECEYMTSSDWYREQTPCRVSVHDIE